MEQHDFQKTASLRQDDLDSLEKIKNDFLNIIAHEVRTALNGISGPIDLLKNELDEDKSSNLIKILEISVSRLERFAITALKITELKTREENIPQNEINLAELINHSSEGIYDLLQNKNIHLHIYPAIDTIIVHGDILLLRVCLENILDNAIKHSPAGSTVFIQACVKNNAVICEVTDYGNGFSDYALKNLFNLFTPSGPYYDNNLGLNLTLCKLIMEAHSGRIEVENMKEGGAAVRMVFEKA